MSGPAAVNSSLPILKHHGRQYIGQGKGLLRFRQVERNENRVVHFPEDVAEKRERKTENVNRYSRAGRSHSREPSSFTQGASRSTDHVPRRLPALAILAIRTFARHSRRVPAPHIDVKYVAHLARLRLTAEEEEIFGAQLAHVLDYMETLNQLDVSQVEPTAHAVPLANVTRPDEPHPSLPHEEAMRNAPAPLNGLFQVPKIVE